MYLEHIIKKYLEEKYPIKELCSFSHISKTAHDAWLDLVQLVGSDMTFKMWRTEDNKIQVDVNVDLNALDFSAVKTYVGRKNANIQYTSCYPQSGLIRDNIIRHFHINESMRGNGGGWWSATWEVNTNHPDYAKAKHNEGVLRVERYFIMKQRSVIDSICSKQAAKELTKNKAHQLKCIKTERIAKEIHELSEQVKLLEEKRSHLLDIHRANAVALDNTFIQTVETCKKRYLSKHKKLFSTIEEYFNNQIK